MSRSDLTCLSALQHCLVAASALLGSGCSAGGGASATPDPFAGSTFSGAGNGATGNAAPGSGGAVTGNMTGGAAGFQQGAGGAGAGEGGPQLSGLGGQGGSGGSLGGSSAGGTATVGGAGSGMISNGGQGGGGMAAGGSGMGGGGSSAGNVVGCEGSGVFVCEGFETATLGVFPDGTDWVSNFCASHVVDDAEAHSGSLSLRGGAELYPACMGRIDVSAESEIYVRSWVRLGDNSSESGHEVGLIEFGPTDADNPEVRIGFRNNDSVCVQDPGLEVTTDGVAGGERTVCTGRALDANRWYCLEVHFTRSAGSISFGVQVDGSSVVPETLYDDAVAAWSDGPLFVKIGRSSYGGNNVWPVWHDDVVLSRQPIGCAE